MSNDQVLIQDENGIYSDVPVVRHGTQNSTQQEVIGFAHQNPDNPTQWTIDLVDDDAFTKFIHRGDLKIITLSAQITNITNMGKSA